MGVKIYTRTGDTGETSILGGERVKKNSARVKAYGSLDELNSQLGLLISTVSEKLDPKEATRFVNPKLTQIQQNLFLLGSHLATPKENRVQFQLPQFSHSEQIQMLENSIDAMEIHLEPLKNFILPGGSQCGSQAHVCRTLCRRAEREVVDFLESEPDQIPDGTIGYLNRLSDFLFVLARYLNKQENRTETRWP